VLYVFEMIKFELLEERYRQLFTPEPKPGEIRFGKPE